MNLCDLFPAEALAAAIAAGLVTERAHPDRPDIRVLNYTQKAQFEGTWDEVTAQCRGLVYDAATGHVLARPLRKFFNYGQAGAATFSGAELVTAADKMDGSLGLVVPLPDGQFCVATRGSFESGQAELANGLLRGRYAGFLAWLDEHRAALDDHTVHFEIVGPSNPIVLRHYAEDELVLLGATHDGAWTPAEAGDELAAAWQNAGGRIADVLFRRQPLAAVLAAPPRPNAEGLVVTSADGRRMVKCKQEDYLRLHRIIFGLNAQSVWEQCGRPGWIESLPDEFQPAVADYAATLRSRCDELTAQAEALAAGLSEGLDYPLDKAGRIEVVRRAAGLRGPKPVLAVARNLAFDGPAPEGGWRWEPRQRETLWKMVRPFGVTAIPGIQLEEE
jgi:RNA ligase